jgi:secreted PhoX family phosphatase
MTPDYKAIFINVQHPGEDSADYASPSSNWPATQKEATKLRVHVQRLL